jgi:hypothetical protein
MAARKLMIILMSLMMSLQAGAEVLEGTNPSKFSDRVVAGASSIWRTVKTTVSGFFAQWSEPKKVEQKDRQPSAAQEPQPVEEPKIAAASPSESVSKGTSEKVMKEISASVKEQKIFTVAKPSRAPDAQLPLSRSGVPYFEVEKTVTKKSKSGKTSRETVRVSRIPSLDIGVEAMIKSTDFVIKDIEIPRMTYEKYGERSSPAVTDKKDVTAWLGPVPVKVGPPEKLLIQGFDMGLGVVTLQKVEAVAYKLAQDAGITTLPVKEMDEEDLKFIRGLMMYAAGDKCHFASGIFYDLRNSKKDNVKAASKFYLGDCLQKMGLYTESQKYLFETLGSEGSSLFKNKVLSAFVEFPEEFNASLGSRLEKFVADAAVTPDQKAKLHYMVAVSALKKESFQTARNNSEAVPESHGLYIKSQFILGLSDYHLGKVKQGLDRLKKLQTLLPKENVHRDLHALISINLARMAFQDKQYAEASRYYLSIEKNHPLWIQGLIEHAWTQLMADDSEGAIGNMFSLQSTYLKAVYKPESYIVRTIGYINLCQYADAYKSLSLLEKEYRPWIERIKGFQKLNGPLEHYNTMIKYLSSPSGAEVGGLPYQALREIGRHKDFLNYQEMINSRIDESEQYKFIDQYANKDSEKARWMRNQATARMKQIDEDLKKIKNGVKLAKDENQLKQERSNERNTIDFYDFQLSVFKEASASYKSLRDSAKANLAAERQRLATRAGEVLKSHLNRVVTDLNKYFENNEFLRYEVFAGSGENIRFHMAGGESGGKRIPANIRPENKNLNWDFEGEFWEDEIGHYKSSLKNNCPKDTKAAKN